MNVSIATHEDRKLAQRVREIVLEDYRGPGNPSPLSIDKYEWLRNSGSRLWLDTGDMQAAQQVWSAELDALTTNNTLVNQVVQTGKMDRLIAYGAAEIRKARPEISTTI